MNWRCGFREGRLRCMMGPEHEGCHRTLFRGRLVYFGPIRPIQKRVEPEPAPEPPPIAPLYSTRLGRKRTPETRDNIYVGLDEGMHASWDLTGHEILPLPALDQIEAVLA